MTKRIRIDLPVLLPNLPDEQDECVSRLEDILGRTPGITTAHVRRENGGSVLCLHYDPAKLSLAQAERVARGAGASITKQFGHTVFPVRIVDGEDAARRIEADLGKLTGVLHVSVNQAAQRVGIEFDQTLISADQLRDHMGALGFASAEPVAPNSAATPACCRPRDVVAADAGWYVRNKELVWSLAAGLFLLLGWVGERFAGLPPAYAIPLFLIAYGFGAFDLVRHWLGSALKGNVGFDIDLLMLLAAAGAAALGEWAEGAFLLFLFSLAHALEHYALGRARNAIKALADLAPATAHVLRGTQTVEVPIEEVVVGETVVIRPAEQVSVDGTVISGNSAVNQAPITGESVPVEKTAGDEVFAGTINGTGALQIKATRVAGDRTLDRVIRLVEEAQTQKAPTQLFTERFERIFVPIVLVADVLLIVVPAVLGWWTWNVSFYRGMSLLVAASPCALALGTPATVLAAIAQAARNGVLVKGGAYLENLGTLKAIALDKTGTLTRGEPEVTDVVASAGVEKNDLLRVAAAVEQHSQHPLARAVVRYAENAKLQIPTAGDLQSITARGVRSMVNGRTVEIGNLRLWEEAEIPVPAETRAAVEDLQNRGRSTLITKEGDRWLGVIGVADQPRENARAVLDTLRRIGISHLVMLTGDNRGVAAAVAADIGLTEFRAELLPEDKVTAIRELTEKYGHVAMVGDGVNDAPALANATVGIAMGGAGTAAALETADVALMGDDLDKLPFAMGLSRKAKAIIRQNLFLSLAVIATLILATTTGVFGIGEAVLLHEGSTLVVIANALRLLTYKHAVA